MVHRSEACTDGTQYNLTDADFGKLIEGVS